MNIELKEIDKDTLKVGDVVGVARKIGTGYGSIFRHCRIIPAVITRITPKRTKIETDQFGTHGKECNILCDDLDQYEYMEDCPDYVKENSMDNT